MLKAVKYRLYPTQEQKVLLDKHIGSARFVYNLALETKQIAYAGSRVNLSCFDLIKQLPELKKECEWLKEVNSQTLQQSITNLDTAFTNFFKGQANFPKYKSKKKGNQSFNVPQNVILDFDNEKLVIPKFKKGIKAVFHRKFDGNIKQATISKTPTGKYFASVLFELNHIEKQKPKILSETTIGIDLGIKDFLITSNGDKINNPKYLKNAISKLKFVQSKYSKNKGKRTKQKLAKLHEKVANQRLDFLHKVSIKLIRENQTIALETLQIKNMVKNHKLAQSIIDVSWGKFIEMLKYKAEWYCKDIIRIGTFEPSSKTCSNCGRINKDLKLSDRNWNCNHCKINHDRDINAAINIKNFALRNHVSGTDTKIHSELPTLVGVMTYEACYIASSIDK